MDVADGALLATSRDATGGGGGGDDDDNKNRLDRRGDRE